MTEKVCSHCKKIRPLGEFNKNRFREDGLKIHCRQCHNRAQKRHMKNPRSRHLHNMAVARHQRKHPERHRANQAVYMAVKKGKIIRPEVCPLCEGVPVEAHHEDYSKPLDIDWLCKKCHTERHRERV